MYIEVPKNDTISHGLKDLLVTDGQSLADIWVGLEDFIDMVGEGNYFWLHDGMIDRFLHFIKEPY